MKTANNITVTNAGGTELLNIKAIPSLLGLFMDGGSVTLAADFNVDYSELPAIGATWTAVVYPTIDLNGKNFSVYGVPFTSAMQNSGVPWIYEFMVVNSGGATLKYCIRPLDFSLTNFLSALILKDATMPLSKIVDVPAAQVIMGNILNKPTATTISGDITLNSSGVSAIGSKKVLTGMINDKAIQILQMADLARGHSYVGDGTNRPAAFDMRTALHILCGNAAGTDPVMVPVGGDLTMPAPGVFRLANTVGAIYRMSVAIDSAALLTGNGTPLEILAAQGIGRTINVIDAIVDETFVTTPYATNTTLEIYTEGATVAQKSLNCLGYTTDRIVKMSDVAISAAGNTQLIPNARLLCRVATGDPTAGDGTIIVTVYFTILT